MFLSLILHHLDLWCGRDFLCNKVECTKITKIFLIVLSIQNLFTSVRNLQTSKSNNLRKNFCLVDLILWHWGITTTSMMFVKKWNHSTHLYASWLIIITLAIKFQDFLQFHTTLSPRNLNLNLMSLKSKYKKRNRLTFNIMITLQSLKNN